MSNNEKKDYRGWLFDWDIIQQIIKATWVYEKVFWKLLDDLVYDKEIERLKEVLKNIYWYKDIDIIKSEVDNIYFNKLSRIIFRFSSNKDEDNPK